MSLFGVTSAVCCMAPGRASSNQARAQKGFGLRCGELVLLVRWVCDVCVCVCVRACVRVSVFVCLNGSGSSLLVLRRLSRKLPPLSLVSQGYIVEQKTVQSALNMVACSIQLHYRVTAYIGLCCSLHHCPYIVLSKVSSFARSHTAKERMLCSLVWASSIE